VRFPTVDASPGLEFTKSAVEAVKKTARLDRQPVAVLIAVSIHFRFYNPLLYRALEHLSTIASNIVFPSSTAPG